jgi:hypothetical protein
MRFEAYTRGTILSDYMTVIFEPIFQGALIPGQWQTWTINDSAVVYQTRANAVCNQVTQCSFADFKAAYPRAAFFDAQLGVGSFTSLPQPILSYVDAVHLSFTGGAVNTDFDVSATPVAPVATPDEYATPQISNRRQPSRECSERRPEQQPHDSGAGCGPASGKSYSTSTAPSRTRRKRASRE